MSNPFVAEIRMFCFNFAPKGWAWCDGQLLPISQNTALFSLLGTTYGGDGKSTFALPNMQGSSPMAPGQGPGLSLHDLGEQGGSQDVTLLLSEIPVHSHSVNAAPANFAANSDVPTNNAMGKSSQGSVYVPDTQPSVTMSPNALSPAGGNLPHNNMMPYLAVYFAIAMQGVYPARN
jgi:microcystin-dependent protein